MTIHPHITMLTAMGLVLVTWASLGAMLLGVGLLLQRCLRLEAAPEDRLWLAFWTGLGAVIAFLQVWNLFLPVAWAALVVLVVAGGMGPAWSMRSGPGVTGGSPPAGRPSGRFLLAALVVAVWLANRALGPPIGDSGIYHLSMIRWLTAYPLVPGLGNLQERLAFNNASLLWPALLEVGFWHGRSSHLAMGLLILAFMLRVLACLGRCLGGSWRPQPADVFTALLAAPLVAHAVTVRELRLSGPDPDTATALVLLAGMAQGVTLWTRRDRSPGQRRHDLTFVTLMFTLAACMKLSVALFAVPALVVTAAVEWNRQAKADRTGGAARTRTAVLGAAIVAALVVPWLVRGIVLSGYPLYPAMVLGLPVEWRMPPQITDQLGLIRQHFMPPVADAMVRQGRPWWAAWLIWQATRCPELILFPALLIVVGAATLVVTRRRTSLETRGSECGALWLLVPVAVGVAAWWVTAPAPRFAYPLFWGAAAALGTAVAFPWLAQRPLRPRVRGLAIAVWLVVALFPLAHRLVAWAAVGDWQSVRETLVIDAGPDRGFHPTPAVDLRTVTTASGLSVYVPAAGGDQVWDAPLPATSSLSPGLALRRPGDLGSGFMVIAAGRPEAGTAR